MKSFAELADPFVALMRKGVPFMWGDEQQKAFDALKACLLSAPIFWIRYRKGPVCVRHGCQFICDQRYS